MVDRAWQVLPSAAAWTLPASAYAAKRYANVPYPSDNAPRLRITVRERRYTGISRGFGVRTEKYADALRIGRRVFDPGEHVSAVQRLAYYAARASVALRRNYFRPPPPADFWEFAA